MPTSTTIEPQWKAFARICAFPRYRVIYRVPALARRRRPRTPLRTRVGDCVDDPTRSGGHEPTVFEASRDRAPPPRAASARLVRILTMEHVVTRRAGNEESEQDQIPRHKPPLTTTAQHDHVSALNDEERHPCRSEPPEHTKHQQSQNCSAAQRSGTQSTIDGVDDEDCHDARQVCAKGARWSRGR